MDRTNLYVLLGGIKGIKRIKREGFPTLLSVYGVISTVINIIWHSTGDSIGRLPKMFENIACVGIKINLEHQDGFVRIDIVIAIDVLPGPTC